jgi:hypothetical protein
MYDLRPLPPRDPGLVQGGAKREYRVTVREAHLSGLSRVWSLKSLLKSRTFTLQLTSCKKRDKRLRITGLRRRSIAWLSASGGRAARRLAFAAATRKEIIPAHVR